MSVVFTALVEAFCEFNTGFLNGQPWSVSGHLPLGPFFVEYNGVLLSFLGSNPVCVDPFNNNIVPIPRLTVTEISVLWNFLIG